MDRALDIPGDGLMGSMPATELVSWYGGHPDAVADSIALTARSVVVVGAGNVALDVTRMLAKEPGALIDTDVPQHVLDVLANSQIADIHLVARRGPAHAKFTTKELRELGKLPNVDIVVDPAELVLDDEGQRRAEEDRTVQSNLDTLREWSQQPVRGRPRRIHIRFLLSPLAIHGECAVESVEFERMVPDGAGGARSSGRQVRIPAQLVVRSIGYRGVALPGVVFDATSGTIPNLEGRVVHDGSNAPGQYVVGWIKRGPTGVIGTNRPDAKQTVGHLLDDLDHAGVTPRPDLYEQLPGEGVRIVDWTGWQAIERHEESLGRAAGRKRVKVTDRAELFMIGASKAPAAGHRRHAKPHRCED